MVVVTPDARRAFVANIGSGSVTVIDLEGRRRMREIETGEGAEGLSVTPDGKEVWVANRAADTLTIIDAASLEVRARLDCPGFPIRIAISPDGKRALVSTAQSGAVALFDVSGRREIVRRTLDLSAVEGSEERLFGDRFGASPVPVGLVIAPDGRSAWVAATQADAVVELDPETLEVRDVIRAGREPDGMAFRPDDSPIEDWQAASRR
jgi:YVTN family beta-propeller protein